MLTSDKASTPPKRRVRPSTKSAPVTRAPRPPRRASPLPLGLRANPLAALHAQELTEPLDRAPGRLRATLLGGAAPSRAPAQGRTQEAAPGQTAGISQEKRPRPPRLEERPRRSPCRRSIPP